MSKWEAVQPKESNGYIYIVDKSGEWPNEVATLYGGSRWDDARLIESAPDLLESLKDMVFLLESAGTSMTGYHAIHVAKQLIAKIEATEQKEKTG